MGKSRVSFLTHMVGYFHLGVCHLHLSIETHLLHS